MLKSVRLYPRTVTVHMEEISRLQRQLVLYEEIDSELIVETAQDERNHLLAVFELDCDRVPVAGDRIVAMGMVCIRTIFVARIGEIENIVVDGPYRGRGIGTRLIDELEEIARFHRREKSRLTSSRRKAQKHYLDLGYYEYPTMVLERTL